MTKDLEQALNEEKSEELFFRYKHDGAIDFEKKLLAGKLLYERGFDKKKLIAEKQLTIDSINNRIRFYEDTDQLIASHRKKMNRGILFGLGYITSFIVIGLSDYFFNDAPINWTPVLVMIALAVLFLVQRLASYNKRLNHLLEIDRKDNELLKYRLQMIEREWVF